MVIYRKTLILKGRKVYIELTQRDADEAFMAFGRGERVIVDLTSAIEEVQT